MSRRRSRPPGLPAAVVLTKTIKGGIAVKKIALLAAAVAAIAGAGALGLTHAPQARAADPAPPPLAQCVDTHSLNINMIVSKNQVVLEDSFHHAALLTLSQPCTQMDSLDGIGFLIEGDSRLCQIHDVKILYTRQGLHEPPSRCLITDMKPLTKDEVKAYSSPSASH